MQVANNLPPRAQRRKGSLVRTRVEPKTFFANERTFLQWLQISVLILFTGLSLLAGSSVAPSAAGGGGGTSCTGKGCQAGQVRSFLFANPESRRCCPKSVQSTWKSAP